MPVLSDSTLLARMPSGNSAVYSLPPQHLNGRPGSTLNQRCIEHGKQLAHWYGGLWFEPGGWVEILDIRRIALLERAPEA